MLALSALRFPLRAEGSRSVAVGTMFGVAADWRQMTMDPQQGFRRSRCTDLSTAGNKDHCGDGSRQRRIGSSKLEFRLGCCRNRAVRIDS